MSHNSSPDCGDEKLCKPCSLPSETSRIQSTSKLLRQWLTLVTCIPWYHSHQDKPEQEFQHGVIEFISGEKSGSASQEVKPLNDNYDCLEWERNWKYTLRLTVKSFKKFQNESDEILIYPFDVLADIKDKYDAFHEVRSALSQQGLTIKNFFDVFALVKDDDGCCWDNQAQMNIEICLTRKVSMSQKQLTGLCLRFCEGDVFCPEPREDC